MDYLAAIRSFVRAVDLGSFSKAAAESGLKVSTVSRHVASLEADMRVALLNRSTHSLHVTEAGRIFHERASRILIEVEEARTSTASLNDRPQGTLRLNMPVSFGRRHVMAHLKEFLARYPDIRIDATLTDATVDLIEAGADVAVRIGALSDSTLVARRLATQHRVPVASPGYLASRPRPQRPQDLSLHVCLCFALQADDAWYCRTSQQPGAPLIRVEVQGPLRVNDSEALREAALADLGVALLPTWLVVDDLRAGRLEAMLVDHDWQIAPGPERAIWAIYPPKKVVSPKVSAFIAFLMERFGSPAYWDRPAEGR
ncbi:MAG: LysR family transcriptional regulator [Burkholderiaceae bacterium]|nr:LysR family transcriptional regulator [Roseateles sp.]MBV8468416.1 LysR family transcriptional regulator [Burkholderiaceae bacterium]